MSINQVCLPENYSPLFFIDLHERFPATFIVAEDDGRLGGYVMCRIETGFSSLSRTRLTKKGHVVSIAVLPEHRRKGLGSQLVTKALKAMEVYKATECFLEVRVSNHQAVSMYKQLGFTEIRVKRRYYADGEDAYMMAKKLQ
ncbi:MAG: ribosomal protein S18-alanine N-acetyltransferase [Candidatus Bathyarchaeota archaeon]|nr:MAG: ribosomal protein S18-alanine N-acetyltransferase [Candidatus Bathyarchaeota archaeon]